jgi:hypothetical protein
VEELEPENNSSNNSETIPKSELFEGDEKAPEADTGAIKKLGIVGRKRKYEKAGLEDINPVKDVVLFRYKTGRHWPGLSKDMEDWYEHYYFTKPTRAERAKDAREYERHIKSYERGRAWIAEDAQAVGDSGKVPAYRKRARR